jgi:1-acyl-sn-glycerol-3-phosphate acyltransferase
MGFGLEETTVERGTELLQDENLVLIFPEGEKGNFKATWKRYRLQRFHTGFVRMAIQAQAPIVPCLVIGAEESHLNLGSVDLSSYLKGFRLPIPLSLLPLPAKWKIKFLPPLDVSEFPAEKANDREFNAVLSARIQNQLQRELIREIKKRPYVYFRHPLRKRSRRRVSAEKRIVGAES